MSLFNCFLVFFCQISGAGPEHRGIFLYGLIQRTVVGWCSREKPPP